MVTVVATVVTAAFTVVVAWATIMVARANRTSAQAAETLAKLNLEQNRRLQPEILADYFHHLDGDVFRFDIWNEGWRDGALHSIAVEMPMAPGGNLSVYRPARVFEWYPQRNDIDSDEDGMESYKIEAGGRRRLYGVVQGLHQAIEDRPEDVRLHVTPVTGDRIVLTLASEDDDVEDALDRSENRQRMRAIDPEQ